ncbi:GldG family protein [Hespellia stercorisuis]|uniref:ABC-2 type transport system permease protein n=1 Tax=Hespellia stercorisuis DSM 15480 TaxID=1121950 RepID=A0A1M6UXB6_9FIRM|nr:GldG family protein [Hespellia stercorisuis]SHK73889.1 ABC-2 type transport system permease protein [Hespellia stercorisuis DSM 15480]
MEKIKNIFKTSQTKNGSFSVGLVAIVIAIIVVANLIVGQLPEKIRNIDISSNNLYEITDTSRKLVKNLDHKIKFTVLATKSSTDERITTFISKYAGLSKKISVEWIDPTLHPTALDEYDAEQNTIVVSCPDMDKTTTVAFSDIIVTDQMSAYYSGTASETSFDGEGQLTSAVNYVTNDTSYNIYRTTGHGEATFSTTVSDLLSKASYNVNEVNLVMDAAIPDDCDLLLMYAPTKDLSDDEAAAVTKYLAAGGKVMIIMADAESVDTPNINAIMKTYGMAPTDGYIADTTRCYQGNYYYIFPLLSVSDEMASGISSQMILLINAHGLTDVTPERDTITETPFMTTSSSGYAVTQDGQTQGTYTLGAVATEKTDDKMARLTVISSASMIDAQVTDSFTTLENTTLFMNAVTSNFEGASNISIEAKSLTTETNTMQHGGVISLVLIFVVPFVVLIAGFVVWFRRRKA